MVWNGDRVKLLGINFKSRLNFDVHVDNLITEVREKCHALTRESN